MMTNMDMLKSLVADMRETASSSNEPEEYKLGAVSAFDWVLKQIENG